MATRILISDDHDLFRECVVDRLGQEPDLEVLAQVSDAAQVIPLIKTLSPDVVLMDINMPGSPFVVGQEIRRCFDRTRLIFLTAHPADQNVEDGVRCGACGFVTKDHSADTLLEAVRTVARGGYYFVPEVRSRVQFQDGRPACSRTNAQHAHSLSPREREVLRLLAEGFSCKQVAQALYVSVGTVRNQTSSIMKKLGIHNRAALVQYAIDEKMVSA